MSGVTFLVAVIMTGVTTVLCCKLRSLGSTDVHKLVGIFRGKYAIIILLIIIMTTLVQYIHSY